MAEYNRKQRCQQSRTIANRETGNRQLKEVVDNRSHSIVQAKFFSLHKREKNIGQRLLDNKNWDFIIKEINNADNNEYEDIFVLVNKLYGKLIEFNRLYTNDKSEVIQQSKDWERASMYSSLVASIMSALRALYERCNNLDVNFCRNPGIIMLILNVCGWIIHVFLYEFSDSDIDWGYGTLTILACVVALIDIISFILDCMENRRARQNNRQIETKDSSDDPSDDDPSPLVQNPG